MRKFIVFTIMVSALGFAAGGASARVIHPSTSGTAQICGSDKQLAGCNSQHCYRVDSCGKKTCTVTVLMPAPGGAGSKGAGINPSSVAKGKANVQDLQVTKKTDTASPMLAPQGGPLTNSGTGTGTLGAGGAAHHITTGSPTLQKQ
jgi:hypothetical protein